MTPLLNKELKEMKTKFCCNDMEEKINYKGAGHDDPFECQDHLIYHNKKEKEFGIIVHDGGHSYIAINFCPWCGKPL